MQDLLKFSWVQRLTTEVVFSSLLFVFVSLSAEYEKRRKNGKNLFAFQERIPNVMLIIKPKHLQMWMSVCMHVCVEPKITPDVKVLKSHSDHLLFYCKSVPSNPFNYDYYVFSPDLKTSAVFTNIVSAELQ